MKKRKASGRPPKFREARRPITVTLPERTLQQLAAINADRARAIVKATAAATRLRPGKAPSVAVVEALPGQSVIVVGPSRRLREIEWLRLAEIAPGRHLLVLPSGTAIECLEVAVHDLLDRLPADEAYERSLLTELHNVLRRCRHQREFSKAEILLVRLAST